MPKFKISKPRSLNTGFLKVNEAHSGDIYSYSDINIWVHYLSSTISTNILTRIVGGQWRHKITIYGNGSSVYIHIWQILGVTSWRRQLFTCEYYDEECSIIMTQRTLSHNRPNKYVNNLKLTVDMESGSCISVMFSICGDLRLTHWWL